MFLSILLDQTFISFDSVTKRSEGTFRQVFSCDEL
jgi:hypothetical protein